MLGLVDEVILLEGVRRDETVDDKGLFDESLLMLDLRDEVGMADDLLDEILLDDGLKDLLDESLVEEDLIERLEDRLLDAALLLNLPIIVDDVFELGLLVDGDDFAVLDLVVVEVLLVLEDSVVDFGLLKTHLQALLTADVFKLGIGESWRSLYSVLEYATLEPLCLHDLQGIEEIAESRGIPELYGDGIRRHAWTCRTNKALETCCIRNGGYKFCVRARWFDTGNTFASIH